MLRVGLCDRDRETGGFALRTGPPAEGRAWSSVSRLRAGRSPRSTWSPTLTGCASPTSPSSAA